jgi:hypothetical protein
MLVLELLLASQKEPLESVLLVQLDSDKSWKQPVKLAIHSQKLLLVSGLSSPAGANI